MAISFNEQIGGRFLDRGGVICNVRHPDFGAKGDNLTDDTEAIRAALRTGITTIVPKGDYRIDGTIYLTPNTHLHLMEGARLIRPSGGSPEPVVALVGNDAKLTGTGVILSKAPSPKGVVRVGHTDKSRLVNINWTHIDGISIIGDGAEESIGLDFFSSEPTVGGSNYQCNARNLKISNVGTGAHFSKWCNAHVLSNVFFYRIGRVAWDFDQCMECSVHGGFIHFSPNITCIRLRGCQFVQFIGFHAEPGGRSIYYDIDRGCLQCAVLGHGNCAGAPVNESTSTTILDLGRLSTPYVRAGAVIAPHGRVIESTRTPVGEASSRTAALYVLADPDYGGIRISGISRSADDGVRGGAFLEVTASGFAVGRNGEQNVYQGRWLVSPYTKPAGEPALAINALLQSSSISLESGRDGQSLTLRPIGFKESRGGEVVCEARHVGLPIGEVRIEPIE